MNNTMNESKGGSLIFKGCDGDRERNGSRYRIYRTAYGSEIVLRSVNKGRLLVNKIAKNVLQREVMDSV